ncbi:DUF2332 family protein [Frigoribacterium sp. 2-23]|uniref:DUF2332 family protein n=1 Tax=Frigoribacterium sp. 2-23 TaxID=3415006 RepID=UPI003C6F833F
MTTAERFRAFAEASAADGSPLYAEWADGVAADDELLRVVDRAPEARRQPILVFAVSRRLGAPLGPYAEWRRWLLAHADDVVADLGRRLTQTNDVRRCLPLSLALARVDGPVALLEVGASAGLCLYPDRYAYDAGGAAWGDRASHVRLAATLSSDTTVAAEPPPATAPTSVAVLPAIVWRAGIDLAPVDVRDPEAVDWLETLLPPERTDRATLLRRAVDVARTEPPVLVEGDAVEALAGLAARAPRSATLVVVTMGTLVYLPGARRQAFVDEVHRLGARWISYERSGSLRDVRDPGVAGLPAADRFATLALDGEPLALGDAHGTRLHMLTTCARPAGTDAEAPLG